MHTYVLKIPEKKGFGIQFRQQKVKPGKRVLLVLKDICCFAFGVVCYVDYVYLI